MCARDFQPTYIGCYIPMHGWRGSLNAAAKRHFLTRSDRSVTLTRMATLLAQIEEERARRNEELRVAVRAQLRKTLQELLPAGVHVWVFGSLVKPGRFHPESDVDVAVESLPPGRSEYWLLGELEARLGRRVDVLLFGETRLQAAITREGEQWTV